MKKIKTLIFDLDGTLINTDELIIGSYKEVFRIFRPDYILTREEEVGFLGPTLYYNFNKYFKEDFDTLFDVYYNFSLEHTLDLAKLYNNVIEMLSYLKEKGYRLFIVTSRLKISTIDMMDAFKLNHFFEKVITLSDVSKPKPDPEGINLLIDEFKLNKDEVLYVGDNESDYLAGKNAGVKTCLVSWSRGRDNSKYDLDYLVHDYKEFIDIF